MIELSLLTQKSAIGMSPAARWTVVGLLALAMVIGLLDRINFSVALALKDFQDRFLLTDQDRGLLNSAFFWTYTCLQAPAGWVVDRYGVKRLFTVAVALWGVITAATAVVTFAWQLVLLRLLLGASEALLTPASMRWIRLNCREDQRGIAIGIVMAGTKVGPAIGAWLSAILDLCIRVADDVRSARSVFVRLADSVASFCKGRRRGALRKPKTNNSQATSHGICFVIRSSGEL